MTAAPQDQTNVAARATDGSPLDVMLTDAALGPVRRLIPGVAGIKFASRLASRPFSTNEVCVRHAPPFSTTKVTVRTATEIGRIAVGRSKVEIPKRDRRFADPAWNGNPLLRRLCQAYLVSGNALEDLVEEADLDWRSEQRMRFLVQMLVDGLAPSNHPFLNPAALKAALETGGRNYRDGAKQFVQDMRSRPRIPAMVDGRGFQVGGNLAVTEGAVVLRTPIIELIHYKPRTEQVREVPLLLVPPMINKYYIADLAPGRSMIEHFLDTGQQVFTISWRNPGAEHRGWDLDAYARSVLDALDAVQDITGADRSHLLGICAGGIVSSVTCAHLAARGELGRIAGLALGVTLLDQDRSGSLGAMIDETTAQFAIAQSARTGYLDGKALAGVFAWLRPNDLIWNYWVNNYLLGKRPPAFDVLYWNSDTTRMPAALHRDFIRMTTANALVHPGKMTVLGTPVDLSKVDVDSYVVAGTTDHICPWERCYRSVQLLGGSSRFVLSNAGHIAALVNPASNPKASFQVNDACPEPPEEWLAGAVRHPGTWWSDYGSWLGERSGEQKPAPTSLGSSRHAVSGSAPGTYVLQP